MKCEECKWHYDLTGETEHEGMKNCLALSYPECMIVFSLPTAECNYPKLFTMKEEK